MEGTEKKVRSKRRIALIKPKTILSHFQKILNELSMKYEQACSKSVCPPPEEIPLGCPSNYTKKKKQPNLYYSFIKFKTRCVN